MRSPGRLAIALLLATLPLGCGAPRPSQRPNPGPSASQRSAAEARQRCERERLRLMPLLETLRRSEERLAAVQAESYVPSPAPAPLDPDEQRRLAIYDQEIEQEQHNEAVAAWQLREQPRRERWSQAHATRLGQAEADRAAALQDLQQAFPTLFQAGKPPVLQPGRRDRLLNCAPAAG